MNKLPPTRRPRFTGVRLLTDNDTAWHAKRHVIANARRTLDLCYFIVEIDGSTSRLLLDLIDAAKRGVKVRLLVDYFVTFEQAAALRALASVGNIEVRRHGPPPGPWLDALQAAGIDRDGFVKALMAANGAKLAETLKGNTIFPPATADKLRALQMPAGGSAADFPDQVLAALPSLAEQDVAAGGADADRAAVLHKVALVNQILLGLKQFLHRTHHKLLLADGRWFVMGGRNLADAYQCREPAQGRAFQDADLLARDGQAGGSGHPRSFEALWTHAQTVDIKETDPLDPRQPLPLAIFHDKAVAAPTLDPGRVFRRGLQLPCMDGQLLDNLPSDNGDTAITLAYVEHIDRLAALGQPAVIDVVSAYLLPVDDAAAGPALLALRNSFVAAVRAGLTVNIYTNSSLSTDLKPINQAAYPKLIALIVAGVNVFELADGQGSLHAKCAALGDACLLIGSYNMDPRSELYDTNNLIVLHDPSGVATSAFRSKFIERLQWTRLTRQMAEDRSAGKGRGTLARKGDAVL